jgi:hypothetical protein
MQEMQSETAARPSRCTARSHRTGVPTSLGRSAFERGDEPAGMDPDHTAPRIPETTRVRTRSRGSGP